MLLTEEQARTKWCPHSRQIGVTSRDNGTCATVNREGPEHYGADNCLCIASGCMAWQFGTWTVGGRIEVAKEDGHALGYCGAFGKPEV